MAIGESNNPNFNVQSPASNQALVYDSTQQAFVNANLQSGSGVTGAANVGTGGGVFKQLSGTDLQFRTIVAGNNITITENTDDVTISAIGSVSAGTNLGGGSGLFVDINTGNIRFKSVVAGSGITLTNSNTEVLVSVDSANVDAGTVGGLSSSVFLQKSDNLAAVADVSTARTNLGVYSKTEADAKYQPKAGDILPDADNTRSIGDNSNRYSDIYAVEVHGTATRAGVVTSIADHNIGELLDVNTTGVANGHVLKYNGSAWISTVDAGATNLGALSDVNSAGAANGQVLIYNSVSSQWEPGNMSGGGVGGSSTLVGLTDTPTNYAGAAGYFVKVNSGASAVEFVANPGYITDLTSFSTTDVAEGTNQYFTNARADARIAAASINDLADVDTSGVALNNTLKYNGSAWVVGTVSTDLSANTTTDLAEGTNLYYTTTRANTDFDTRLATKDTDALAEGSTNLYYTTARANTDIDARLTSTGVTGAKITNWDTAYSWGDHSTAGYLTDLTGSTLTSLSDVDAVAGAGDDGKVLYYDHATTSFKWKTESGALSDTDGLPEGASNLYYTDARADARITAAGITGAKVTNWDTAYSWGDHSTAGYLTSFTETNDLSSAVTWANVPDVNITSSSVVQHQANLTITESQISDLGTYQTVAGLNASIDTHLNQSNPTSGYVLSWNGSDYAWVAQSGGSTYEDSDVDAHLNQSNPTAGYVLSWNGSDYVWVAQSASGGGTMSNLVEDTSPQLGGTLDANGNDIDMGTNTITDAKVGNWDTAYSWGDHSTAGYLTAETNDLTSAVTWANVPDANITSSSVVQHQANLTITESQISDLQSYLTSETSHADVVVDGDFTSQGIMLRGASAGSYSILTDNSANWNTAYGWGDHSTAGYLTSVPAQSFASLTGKPTTLAGYGITDGYTNSDVDAHLNQSNPTAGYVLSWNGSDYAWIDNAGYTSFNTDFDTRLGTKTTTDLTEGTNLYYTDARVDSRITGNWLVDEDNMVSDSATKIPSQQSVKAYVDSQVATANELGEMTDVTLTSLANNQFLKYNSSTSQWENATVTASTAAGSDTQVQFNDGGVMGGDAGFTYNKTTDELSVGSVITVGATPSVSAAGNLTIETTASNGNITLTTHGIGVVNVNSDIDMGTNVISDAKVGEWDTAYGWGDHSTAGYLTSVPAQTFASLTGKPTTIAGYGITDAFDGDYNSLTNQPTIPSAYTNSDVDAHLNQSNPTSGYVLSWNGSDYAWVAQSGGGGSSTLDGLTDVTITSASSGQVLKYNGSAWVNDTDAGGIALTDLSVTSNTAFGNGSFTYNNSTGVFTYTPPLLTGYLQDITSENLSDLADVNSTTPTDGQVLTWDNANSYWKPATPSSGGGSSGTEYEEFKINYATNGDISSISDTSSGISSVAIDSAAGGDLTVTFTGYTTPPLTLVMYGYQHTSNKYVYNSPATGSMTLRDVPGGGSSGSPTAFGSFSNIQIRCSEAETGAGRGFGTTTHAWVRFVMGA